jgi:hypothetical protein
MISAACAEHVYDSINVSINPGPQSRGSISRRRIKMARHSSFDSEELDDGPRRLDPTEPLPLRPRPRREEEDDVEPLELGDTSSGARFGKLSDRDPSGSW